jgi:hypothetical protein
MQMAYEAEEAATDKACVYSYKAHMLLYASVELQSPTTP